MIKRTAQALWQAVIRIFAFIGKEIRTILHQPRLIFSLILGPFFILLIFGLGYRSVPRTLHTLFVVPEGSPLEDSVEDYATSMSEQIIFVGITHDADEADERLRNQEVDLVVVTPRDPTADWESNQPSTFSLYHHEIDPLEEVYIQILGQRYIEAINQQVLLTAVSQSQQEARQWRDDVAEAKAHAATARQALAAGERLRAQSSASALQQEISLLTLALGSGVALAAGLEEAGGQTDTVTTLMTELELLQTETNDLVTATQDDTTLNEGQARVIEVENKLAGLDQLLGQYQEMDGAVLVAPFRSESLSITQVNIEPMHFYVPAVIALLLQHLSITLAGLSIIREKLGGAMELFRAAPVTAFEMLLGKYISYLFLTGMLAVVLTALIIFVLRVPQLGDWSYFLLVVLALLLTSLGLGFHISLSARSDSQAIQYGMLTLLSAIFFSGFFLPLYRLALPVQIVSWLLPATYGTVMLQDVMLRGQRPSLLLILGLFTFAAVLFLLAWFRLGRQMVKE